MRGATSVTITFPVYDPGYSRPTLKTGLTFSSGQVVISQDGGAAVNTANLPSEISGMSGVYALTLTAAEMSANFVTLRITPTTGDAFVQQVPTNGAVTGTVITGGGGNSASSFATSRTESTTDYWKDTLLLFTTGTLVGQIKKVSGFTVSNAVMALVTAFTGTPSVGDRFVLINE